MTCLKVFHRILMPLLLIISVTSCADPKYISANGSRGGGSGEKTMDVCKDNLCFSIDWLVGPKFREDSSFILTIRNSNSELVDFNFTPHFYLYMPDHGHPGDPVVATRLEKGLYKIEKVMFFMKGQWNFHISQTQDESGSADDIIFPIAHF